MEDKKYDFPLDHYLSALVRFLDTVPYQDDNYSRSERLKILRDVYNGTAKHFAQPTQQDALQVHPKKMAVIMQTSVQLVVFCWVRLPIKVKVSLSIYFAYIVLLDDSDDDPYPEMQTFAQDLINGKEQRSTFWRLMNDHFSTDFLSHYGGFCALAITRSTLDFFQGCWIETHNFQGFPGSDCYPLFLRRLNGLGGICGGSLFPIATFDEKSSIEEVTTVIAEIEPVIAFVNDLISFYKEFNTPRDQINLVTNRCRVDGITIREAFDRLTVETIRSVNRLQTVISKEKSPVVAEMLHAFVQGYVTWHFSDARYRMRELYERAGEKPDGPKFRKYFEGAMKAMPFDVGEWSEPMPMTEELRERLQTTEGETRKNTKKKRRERGSPETHGSRKTEQISGRVGESRMQAGIIEA